MMDVEEIKITKNDFVIIIKPLQYLNITNSPSFRYQGVYFLSKTVNQSVKQLNHSFPMHPFSTL